MDKLRQSHIETHGHNQGESTMDHIQFAYCATPSDMGCKRREILDAVYSLGLSPIFAGDIVERAYGDDNRRLDPALARKQTMEFLIRFMLQIEVFVLCGISHGTLQELIAALDARKPIYVVLQYQPNWRERYVELKDKYGDPLARLKRSRVFVTLTGERGVGKTWGSAFAIERYSNELGRVLSTTTRPRRSNEDLDSYHFISEDEFRRKLGASLFIEHDIYEKNLYGIDALEVEQVLGSGRIAVMALTPRGVKGLRKEYSEISTIISLYVECPESLHWKNLNKRKDLAASEHERIITAKGRMALTSMPHRVMELADDGDLANIARFMEALDPYALRAMAKQ